MIYWIMTHGIQFMLDMLSVVRLSDDDKDIEIMLLRQQLRIVTRHHDRGPNIPSWEKMTLAILAHRLKQASNTSRTKLARSVLLFKPDTLLKWHRELVRRKWTYRLLIVNERHLYRVLNKYITYYNEARPHQGIEQQTPIASNRSMYEGDIRCRDVLGGIIHDYYRQAA